MKGFQRGLIIAVLGLCLTGPANSLLAETPAAADPQAIIALLKEQNSKLSDDLRRIQREIAALRADLDKPGLEDVFAGIGYIAGLFGIAAFVAARRKR